jgi:putative transposase
MLSKNHFHFRSIVIVRHPRIDVAGIAQHVIQRGVDRSVCFADDEDRRLYLSILRDVASQSDCQIHAYVLMTNHVHMLVTGEQLGSISTMMQGLGRRYVQYFNSRYHRTGTLWEGRFKSSLVDSENYILRCYRYIELNPVRAQMVLRAEDYKWSSANANAFGKPDPVVSPHPAFLNFEKDHSSRLRNYQALLCELVSEHEISKIRAHINQGKVLGSKRFQQEIEELVGRSVGLKLKGRPKKGG